MAVDDVDALPDRNAAKGFYSKYEPKEVLGKGGCSVVRRCIGKWLSILYSMYLHAIISYLYIMLYYHF